MQYFSYTKLLSHNPKNDHLHFLNGYAFGKIIF